MKRLLKPSIVIGLLVLALSILFMLFIAAPMQTAWGLTGMALTELGFLIIGGIVIICGRWNVKEVLPLQKVTVKKVVAIIPLYIGTLLLTNTVSLIQGYFFPESTLIGGEIVDFYKEAPFLVALFCIAVLPAICEEFLHRGVILFAVKGKLPDIWVSLIMAVLFGIFHLSVYRFLLTAIIGFSLTYLYLKSHNILLPIIFHFINNAVTVILAYQTTYTTSIGVPLYIVGFYLLICVFVPVSFYLASRMLANSKPVKKKGIVLTVIFTLLFMIAGGIVSYKFIANQPTSNILYQVQFTHELNAEDFDDSNTVVDQDEFFNIEKEGEYHFYFSAAGGNMDARAGVTVFSDDGEELWAIGGGEIFADKDFILPKGEYHYHFDYYMNQEISVPMDIVFNVYTIN